LRGVYLGIIEFRGYREWTESIGSDREWRLQITQSKIYLTLQEAAARVNGFILPLRYDYMLLVASGLSREAVEKVYHAAMGVSPVPVSMSTACGVNPRDAVERAWEHLGARNGLYLGEKCQEDYVVAAHFDINNITRRTRRQGLLDTYTTVLSLIARLQEEAHRRGAVSQYLGGDNVLALLPLDDYEEIVNDMISFEDLKAGIGIASSSRRALTLAAEALHRIRTGESREKIVVLEEK